MKIRFVGEGVTDVGAGDLQGVVPVLTRRVLAGKLGDDFDMTTDVGHLFRFHRIRGFPAKARETILEATRQGVDGVVIVVDRDGPKNSKRLSQLKDGREQASGRNPGAVPTAVGVAVEALEAWLLADEQALKRALVLEHVDREPDPETLAGKKGSGNHPKDHLSRWFGNTRDRTVPVPRQMESVAQEVDLKVLERRCRKGFGAYAKEVREVLVPLFSSWRLVSTERRP